MTLDWMKLRKLIQSDRVKTSLLPLILATYVTGCCASQPDAPCRNTQSQTKRSKPRPSKPILEVRGGHHLEKLHPELARRARLLYERAQAEGIILRFISGYRRYRVRQTKPGRSKASWHNFGAAFDVLLHKRKGMKDSLSHLSEDQASWDRVGQIAKELNLIWGKPWGEAEIFHFEWHPGHPEALRAPALKRLLKVTGPQAEQYEKAWDLFDDSKS